MTTADLIRTALVAKGWGVATLASATGIPRMTLNRRLLDPSTFTLRELALVGNALDIPFADLATPVMQALSA